MKIRHLLISAGLVLLSGCSLGRAMPATTTYVVEAPAGVVDRALRNAEMLRLGTVRVAAPFAGTALMYRLSDVRYAADPYHAFLSEPGAMLAARISLWLRPDGRLPLVTAGSAMGSAAYVIEANVVELYGDFRPGQAPAAVLGIQFSAIDQTASRPTLRYERLIRQRIDLSGASPEVLVQGFGSALTAILEQLASDLSSQLIEH